MKNAWVINLIYGLSLGVLLYFWKFEGILGAGNLLSFMIAFFTVISFIALIFGGKQEPNKSPLITKIFNYAIRIAVLSSLAWFGHWWLATGLIFSLFVGLAIASKEKEQ